MIRKLFIYIIINIYFNCIYYVHAQQPFIQSINRSERYTAVETKEGKWIFSLFPNHIIKATFFSKNSTHNEQISDAVIAKPDAILANVQSDKNNATVLWSKKYFVEVNNEGVALTPHTGTTISLLQTFCNDSSRGFKFSLHPDEMIFGTGERSIPMNRRGYRLPLYNSTHYNYGINTDALNFSVPFILSSNHYAIFFDNPSKGYLDIGKTNNNILEYSVISGELSFYVIGGSTFEEIVTSYQKLVGTQQLPPRWALGNFMSRFGYVNENQVRKIYNMMKNDSIPFDAVIFDLFWFGDSIKTTLGNLDWMNKKAWPDPKKMIADFKKEGVKTILITEPFVLKTTHNYKAAEKYLTRDIRNNHYVLKDFYFGQGGLLDIFRKDAQQWFWSKYKKQMDNGVTGWWGDLGEPERHPSDMYHDLSDLGFKRKFSADEVHNLYGYYWSKMIYDNFSKYYPNQRLFHLNRSGYAASPRYSSFPWSGDVARSWSGLQAQLPLMLGTSISGIPYIHADAGGFALGNGDPELYVRWLQFAAFTPIFKPHGTEVGPIDTTVPNFPSEPALWPEPTKSLARKAVQLRYDFLPYNYTLAYEQATKGKPLVKPLFLVDEKDTNLYSIEKQYMWGDALLIAPVLEKNVSVQKIYLPKGAWYDYFTNKKYNGNQWLEQPVTMDRIPVFVKEGSFIPHIQIKNNTTEYNKSDLMVTYYPSPDSSSYELYEDDGESKSAIRNKGYELTTFKSAGFQDITKLSISSNGGKYNGQNTVRNIVLTISYVPIKPQVVLVNNKAINVQEQGGTELPNTINVPTWNNELKKIFICLSAQSEAEIVMIFK